MPGSVLEACHAGPVGLGQALLHLQAAKERQGMCLRVRDAMSLPGSVNKEPRQLHVQIEPEHT
jgi:hypothetical protein